MFYTQLFQDPLCKRLQWYSRAQSFLSSVMFSNNHAHMQRYTADQKPKDGQMNIYKGMLIVSHLFSHGKIFLVLYL